MKAPAHILILAHKFESFEKTPYYMRSIAELWRAQGLKVTIQYGLGPKVDADVLVLHVDLTVVPDDYLAFVRQYPVVLNGNTVDISKRAISQYQVRPGDGYTGPVIVKTNLNCNGVPETKLARETSALLRAAHFVQRVRNKISPIPEPEYKVYPSALDVPAADWSNRDMIIERFFVERAGEEYVARTYHFLGDQEICNAVYATHPVTRSHNILRRVPTTDVPASLRQRRRELGFDFGKFDYTVVDGKAIVYDANRTPTEGGVSREILEPRFRQLAEGIKTFLPA